MIESDWKYPLPFPLRFPLDNISRESPIRRILEYRGNFYSFIIVGAIFTSIIW